MFLQIFSLILVSLTPLAYSIPPEVPITVYYESLCPDSINFFTTQLYPTYTSPLKPRLNITLVPYGKSNFSEVDGSYNFTCHHGPNECYGNKVQACAIKKVTDKTNLMALLNCLMGTALANKEVYPITACAEKSGVAAAEIIFCANGTEGSKFLAELGNITDALIPKLKSVPTIVINDTYNDENQGKALKNLRGLLCSFVHEDKPKICNSASAAVTSFSALLLLGILRLL